MGQKNKFKDIYISILGSLNKVYRKFKISSNQ